MMTDPNYRVTYAPFFAWLWQWLAAGADPAKGGYWCLPPNAPPPASAICLGGAFHVSFLLKCGGQPLPHPAEMLNMTLAMQSPSTGLWNKDEYPGYIDQDGVYVTTRASAQLGGARAAEVRVMCDRFLATAQRVLTNATLLLTDGSPYGTISHVLAGVVTSVAECARVFPDLVRTVRPWVNTVDVGCFG